MLSVGRTSLQTMGVFFVKDWFLSRIHILSHLYFYNSSRVVFLKWLPSSASREDDWASRLSSSTVRWKECVDGLEGWGCGWDERSTRHRHEDDGTMWSVTDSLIGSPRDDKLCNLFLGWICNPPKVCLASHPPHPSLPALVSPTDTHVGTRPSREGETQ